MVSLFLNSYRRYGPFSSIPLCSSLSAYQKLETWFQNHRPHKKEKAKSTKNDHSLLGQWTVRKLVQQTMKEEINRHIEANEPNAVAGSKDYIASYQEACTNVIAALTPAQLAECERQAEEWNTTGPDATTQAM
jgi:hypothetical protein